MSTNYPAHHLASEGALEALQARPIKELTQVDDDGRTTLHWAAATKGEKGHQCIEYILQNIPQQQMANQIDHTDESHWTPLMIAASVGNATTTGKHNNTALMKIRSRSNT